MAEIDSLEIKISADASKATAAIDKLSESFSALKSATSGGLGLKNAAAEINGFANAVKSSLPALTELAKALKDIKGADLGKAMNAVKASAVSDNIKVPTQTPNVGASGTAVSSEIENIGKAVDKVTPKIHSFGRTIEKTTSILGNFGKSLKRIVFYRMIRSVMSGIRKAFQEGIQNIYQYSKALNNVDASHASATMDSFASDLLYMKNSLAAAVMPILNALVPVVQRIASAFASAANAVAAFFAALGGGSKYTAAIRKTTEFGNAVGGAAGKAEELKRTLLGFDEINRLEAPNDGGGGGGGGAVPDYANMFDEFDIPPKILELAEKIRKAFERIKEAVERIKVTKAWQWLMDTFQWLLDKGIDVVLNNIAKAFELLATAFEAVSAAMEGDWDEALVGLLNIDIGILDTLDEIIGFFEELSEKLQPIKKEELPKWLQILLGVIEWENPITRIRNEIETFRARLEALRFIIGNWDEKWDNFKQKVSGAVQWVKDFLGINSPSTVFKEIGRDIVQGLWDGITEKWNAFKSWFERSWENLSSWWKNLHLPQFNITLPHISVVFDDYGGGWGASLLRFLGVSSIPHLSVQWYAQGGFPEDGLFMANHGELVGQFSNGRTAVANNEQIIEGIKTGVYDAVLAAMNNSNGNNQRIELFIDGRKMTDVVTRHQRQNARAYG